MKPLGDIGGKAVHAVLDAVWPSACFGCGRALPRHQQHGACLACWTGFEQLRPPLCPRCGLPRPAQTDLLGPALGHCSACVLAPGPLDAVRALVAYDPLARAFLLRSKVAGRRELLEPLGALLAGAARRWPAADTCLEVVPVPSHPWMTLRRGFSPAAELARPVARALGLRLRSRRLYRRWRGISGVKGLAAGHRRRATLSGIRARGRCQPGTILLVDDVMTSGASLRAAALALRGAGARAVIGLVWARTLPGGGRRRGGAAGGPKRL